MKKEKKEEEKILTIETRKLVTEEAVVTVVGSSEFRKRSEMDMAHLECETLPVQAPSPNLPLHSDSNCLPAFS